MAQGILNLSSALANLELLTSKDLKELNIGIKFPDDDTAVEAILGWGEKNLCPLAKSRRDKGLAETGRKRRGRRCLDCPHGRNRKAQKKFWSKNIWVKKILVQKKFWSKRFGSEILFF